MKILFLTSRFPFPLEKGDKLRAYHQIKELSKYHEIHLVCIVDDDPLPDHIDKISKFTTSIHTVSITPLERFYSVVKASWSGIPYQIAWFYSLTIKALIDQIYLKVGPDHCFCQLTRMAEYAKDFPCKKTLDYMDSFGTSMHKRGHIAGFPSSWLYNLEAKRMIDYEATISHFFDFLTIISDQDKSYLDFKGSDKIQVVGNGVSEEFTGVDLTTENKYELVFVGNMSYLPNIESVQFLVNKILPLLPSHFKLLIAGANPDPRVVSISSPRVCVSGWVADIRLSYLSGKIFVVPMWSGTGQQNKILEALGLGIPCITTTAVNNAIGAEPDKEIIIAESPEEFAEAIIMLLDDVNKYRQIQVNGKKFVKQNFDWELKGTILSSIFAQN